MFVRRLAQSKCSVIDACGYIIIIKSGDSHCVSNGCRCQERGTAREPPPRAQLPAPRAELVFCKHYLAGSLRSQLNTITVPDLEEGYREIKGVK